MFRICPFCFQPMEHLGHRWQCRCGAWDYSPDEGPQPRDDIPRVIIIRHQPVYTRNGHRDILEGLC